MLKTNSVEVSALLEEVRQVYGLDVKNDVQDAIGRLEHNWFTPTAVIERVLAKRFPSLGSVALAAAMNARFST